MLHEFDDIPELTWISEPDNGVVEAVNKGFARAKGKVGAIQSSDDYYLPGAVSTGVEALMRDASLGFVFGDIVNVDIHGTELTRTNLQPFTLEAVLSLQTWIPQPSTFFRLGLANKLGGWREEVPFAADTDLWLRMALVSSARKLDRLLACRTMHEDQRDNQGEKIVRDFSQMIDDLGIESELDSAAEAGKLLLANRYLSSEGYWVCHRRLKRAINIYPPLRKRVPFSALVPGWYPLYGWMVKH